MGYDGKGQISIYSKNQLIEAYSNLGSTECILEQIAILQCEVSVIVAKSLFETTVYPVTENIHKNGILDISIAPARIDHTLAITLQQLAIKIIDNLNYIGVLTIEFFITDENKILVNEMAPRPHNSGHHTIESCITSQFEQQIRSICNLKLGNSSIHSPSVMLNILGNIYPDRKTPNWNQILNKYDNAKLHLYGKDIAKPSRKMGHITLLGNNLNKLLEQVEEIKVAYMRG
ncbi:MAG: ATP-grasp domain-containing protein, partial [Burkholderiales bacterium]|nr:ATP-grasp domain-containing protein [Burkholderiales bacterium]